MKVIGISKKAMRQGKRQDRLEDIEALWDLKRVNVPLDPYFIASQTEELRRYVQKKLNKGGAAGLKRFPKKTSDADIYGEDVLEKVIAYANEVLRLSRSLDFDVIHAHDWMTFLAGIYVKNETKKPLILHIHSLDFDRVGAASRSWVFNIERHVMSKADMVLAVSNYTAGIIYSQYGLSSKRVLTVHNGIEQRSFSRREKKGNSKNVLFVGRMTGQKGPQYYLDIALEVLKKYKDVNFLMAGAGEFAPGNLEHTKYNALQGRVKVLGFLDRQSLNALFAKVDVFCMPSVSEPFGLAALEAAQHGVPVIVTSRSGVSEVLTGSLRANFWDIEKMADFVVQLFTDEALRRQVVEQNKADVENATWEIAAEKILSAYDSVLHNGE
jgi:glycosyltransferase involved in cell wall biosynthesis